MLRVGQNPGRGNLVIGARNTPPKLITAHATDILRMVAMTVLLGPVEHARIGRTLNVRPNPNIKPKVALRETTTARNGPTKATKP